MVPIGVVKLDASGHVRRWRVEQRLGVSRVRKLWTVTGAGPGMGKYGVHNADQANLLRGLYERVLYRVVDGVARPPPQPAVGVFEEELASVRERIVRGIPIGRPLTRHEFVECYEGRRKEIYKRAADSLAVRPLNKSDSYLSTFTKCEKVNFRTKPDPAPRVIQPRSPRFNVEVGRYLKPLEKRVLGGIAEAWGGTTVLKGLNAEGSGRELRAAWDEFKDPVAFPLDAVRFDQHVSTEALQFEHSIYLQTFPKAQRPKLSRLLEMQLINRGFGRLDDCTVQYEVAGRRMSGDMNTGMGNCLLMCAVILGFRDRVGIKMRLVNNGDDCLVIVERRDKDVPRQLPQWMLRFGFVIDLEPPVDVFEQIEFCQTSPVYDGTRWVMVRNPKVCIDKDLCSVLDLGNRKGCEKWAHAIGTCGLSLTGGIPVLSAFYQMLAEHGRAGKVMDSPWMDCGFKRLAAGMSRTHAEPSPAARLSFWKAFGWLPDLQSAMEQQFADMELEFSAGVAVSPHSLLCLTV